MATKRRNRLYRCYVRVRIVWNPHAYFCRLSSANLPNAHPQRGLEAPERCFNTPLSLQPWPASYLFDSIIAAPHKQLFLAKDLILLSRQEPIHLRWVAYLRPLIEYRLFYIKRMSGNIIWEPLLR